MLHSLFFFPANSKREREGVKTTRAIREIKDRNLIVDNGKFEHGKKTHEKRRAALKAFRSGSDKISSELRDHCGFEILHVTTKSNRADELSGCCKIRSGTTFFAVPSNERLPSIEGQKKLHSVAEAGQ